MAGGPPPDVAAAIARLTPPGRVPDNELVPGRMYKLFNIYGRSWVTVMFVGLATDDDGDTWYMLRNPADGIELPTIGATSPLYRIVDLLAKNAWERRGSAVAAYAKRVEAEEAEAAAANDGHANGGLPNNANRNKNKGSNTKKNKRRSSARKHRKTRRH
jgi:hypothetical protein